MKLTVTRKKSFLSCTVPYYIVFSDIPKDEFMTEYGLCGDLCKHNPMGQAISRIDIDTLNRIGMVLLNGRTVSVDLTDDVVSVFVITMTGSISNEIKINDLDSSQLIILTKGGWSTVSYPYIERQV